MDSRDYVPRSRAIEVGRAGLARHPLGGHGEPRGGGIGAEGDGGGEFRLGGGEDRWADGGGRDAAAHHGVGCHSWWGG